MQVYSFRDHRLWGDFRAPRAHISEKCVDLLPRIFAAVKTLPAPANASDELVASVDGNNVTFEVPSPLDVAHEQRLNVGSESCKQRVCSGQFVPGLQGKQRLRCTHGARIKNHRATQRCVEEEKRHTHGNLESVPLRVGEDETGRTEEACTH